MSKFRIQGLLAVLGLGRGPGVITVQRLRHVIAQYGNTDRDKGKEQNDQACLESSSHGKSGVR